MSERGTKENQVTSALCCVLWGMSHHFKSFYGHGESHSVIFSRIIADMFSVWFNDIKHTPGNVRVLEALLDASCHLKLTGREEH